MSEAGDCLRYAVIDLARAWKAQATALHQSAANLPANDRGLAAMMREAATLDECSDELGDALTEAER